MKYFLTQAKVRKIEFWQFVGIMTGVYLVIGGIVDGVFLNHTEGEGTVLLAMLIVAFATVLVHFLAISLGFVGEFNMALSMGATRRAYVGSYAVFNIAEIAVLEVILVLYGYLERAVLQMLQPQSEIAFDLISYLKVSYLLAMPFAMTILELFFGAVILKYGMKVFWILWAFWMGFSAIMARLSDNDLFAEKLSGLGLAAGGAITVRGGVVFGTAVCILLAAASWKMLRKQRVTV